MCRWCCFFLLRWFLSPRQRRVKILKVCHLNRGAKPALRWFDSCRLLLFEAVVSAALLQLLGLPGRSKAAVAVREVNRGFRLLHVRAGLSRIRGLALHNPKTPIHIRVQSRAYRLSIAACCASCFLLRHLRQLPLSISIPRVSAHHCTCRRGVYSNSLLLGFGIGLVPAVRPKHFHSLSIHTPVAGLRMALGCPRRSGVDYGILGGRRPGFVAAVWLSILSLCGGSRTQVKNHRNHQIYQKRGHSDLIFRLGVRHVIAPDTE